MLNKVIISPKKFHKNSVETNIVGLGELGFQKNAVFIPNVRVNEMCPVRTV